MSAMRYIPNTDRDIAGMLEVIGVKSAEDLFGEVPSCCLLRKPLGIPPPLGEAQLLGRLGELARDNANLREFSSFLGGGTYHHFIPAVVGHLAGRSEFTTSYTPYQPEISQGTLQAIFEYQTFICLLTGLDVSNASMYDGASSAAEAVLMASRIKRTNRVALSRAVHPDYRKTIKTYCAQQAGEIVDLPFDASGRTDLSALRAALSSGPKGGTACALVQSPNFFGIVEPLDEWGRIARENGALFISAFTEPIALGLIKPPGESGADIACGEGQSFGIPPGFGGPHLGILAAKKEYTRNLPGRIVGQGADKEGRRAFVLTLTAREQHIRREKATSNICTNEGLCALTASIYLASLGKRGIHRLAVLNHRRAQYAKRALSRVAGAQVRFSGPTFNEFVLRVKGDPAAIRDRLAGKKILAGIPLGRYHEELGDCLLVTCTEMNSEEEIDELAGALGEVSGP